jgi:hypothetical protein
MNDFLEMYYKPMDNDFMGWFMLILMWILTLIVLGIFIGLILWGIDSLGTIQSGVGTIVDKKYTAGHYIYVYNAATKTSLPTWIGSSWDIYIKIDNLIGSFGVSECNYNKLNIEQILNITYSKVILFESVHIKTAEF